MILFSRNLFVLVYSFALITGENVILNTKYGTLKGLTEQSRGGRSYFAFYGIPYAEPPLGDLRFKVSTGRGWMENTNESSNYKSWL